MTVCDNANKSCPVFTRRLRIRQPFRHRGRTPGVALHLIVDNGRLLHLIPGPEADPLAPYGGLEFHSIRGLPREGSLRFKYSATSGPPFGGAASTSHIEAKDGWFALRRSHDARLCVGGMVHYYTVAASSRLSIG
jgi:hypothetical protein